MIFCILQKAKAKVISVESEVIFDKLCQQNLFQELQFQDTETVKEVTPPFTLKHGPNLHFNVARGHVFSPALYGSSFRSPPLKRSKVQQQLFCGRNT